jgi:hypothetical protein
VLPEIVGKDTVASTYVSLDLLLDDGSRVSAGAARDQHGVAIGARAQGESKTLYPQQWARKAVRLGDARAEGPPRGGDRTGGGQCRRRTGLRLDR